MSSPALLSPTNHKSSRQQPALTYANPQPPGFHTVEQRTTTTTTTHYSGPPANTTPGLLMPQAQQMPHQIPPAGTGNFAMSMRSHRQSLVALFDSAAESGPPRDQQTEAQLLDEQPVIGARRRLGPPNNPPQYPNDDRQ
eukprot:TRINITY_DN67548_c6_g1_i1.p1 TRINITY_DN67548_c6_g1~~TRINITY_DN67548_c6_g1_i1.p1  ORF type:complete len:139 (+),score=23.40 TRINITY_DN67548_c6_g1_i1:292-708(+)